MVTPISKASVGTSADAARMSECARHKIAEGSLAKERGVRPEASVPFIVRTPCSNVRLRRS